MNLKHFRALITVADAGGVSAAARLLHVSQPALSRQIREFEAELGTILFDRAGRHVVLTAAGQEFVARCRSLLIDVESLRERAKALRGGRTGVLRIAAPAQFMESFFPEFLRAYRRNYPAVDVRLFQDVAPRLLKRLERGEFHVAVAVGPPLDASRFDRRALCPVSIVAVMSRHHRLASRKTLGVRDLRGELMLLPERGLYARLVLDEASREQGVELSAILESTGLHSLVALARAGHGVAIVPSTLKFDNSGLRVVPLVESRRPLGGWIVVTWCRERYLPPYAEHFIDQICIAATKAYPGQRIGMTSAIHRPPEMR